MAKVRKAESSDKSVKIRPALSPEARENQMIALAVDAAEEQLMNRTASSQVITHYLKLATAKEKIEREKLELEKQLVAAKIEALQSTKRVEELYSEAIKAMRRYNGHGDVDDDY